MALTLSSTAVTSQLALTAAAVSIHSTSSQHLSCSFLPSKAPQPIRAFQQGHPASRIQPRVSRKTALRVAAEAEGAVAEAPAVAPAVEEALPVAEVAPAASLVSKKKKKKEIAPPSKKQLLILRFLWLEKNIGIALDQLVPGQGTVPVSPYMFWPRKDAWEQLKALLDEKPWVSRKRAIILLNQATDIINLWQTTTFKQ